MVKVSLYLSATLWRAFRIGCLEHDISASQLIGQFIDAQLREWAVAKSASAGGTV